jgi:hypothetical protein
MKRVIYANTGLIDRGSDLYFTAYSADRTLLFNSAVFILLSGVVIHLSFVWLLAENEGVVLIHR